MKKEALILTIAVIAIILSIISILWLFTRSSGEIIPVEGESVLTKDMKIKDLQHSLFNYAESLKTYQSCLSHATTDLAECYSKDSFNSSCGTQYNKDQELCDNKIDYPPQPDPTNLRYD